jgi:hypothetical protein
MTATLWSLGGLWVKFVDWNPLAIAGARSLIAFVVIAAVMPKALNPWPTGAKACFVANLSRYESKLSPSIKRRPRLLPGKVTTTLEINPASLCVKRRFRIA